MLSRALSRLQPRILAGLSKTTQAPARDLTRTLAVLSSSNRSGLSRPHGSSVCSCGCGIHGMHTRGDRELVEFLQEEISAEKKNLRGQLPSHLEDFSIKADKAELTLTKTFHDEKVTVTLNVNHTVDSEEAAELNQDQSEAALKSRPTFEVDLEVGSKTMSFTCSYMTPDTAQEGGQAEDMFGVSELTIYEGEWSEASYCVSGDIMDGMMYDLLMNMLEERGITNEFADKLSEICSEYEHSLYVSLLQNVQNFVKRK